MNTRFFIILLCVGLFSLRALGSDADAGLYYAAEEAISKEAHWETKLDGGFDFSNSYLNIFSVEGGATYLIDPTFSVGLEGALYGASRKGSAMVLADELQNLGYTMYAVSPMGKVNAMFRITPISGMVNFLSSQIIRVDVSAVVRAGEIRYRTAGWGPMGGLGLETYFGFTPSWGFTLALHYDVERPGGTDWLWRGGVTGGPSFRF